MNLLHAAELLEKFSGQGLTGRLSSIEDAIKDKTAAGLPSASKMAGVSSELLFAAGKIKGIAGQINVVIHAVGILRCLPHILEPNERVEYVSLGAGNTGRDFDLETDRRVAEFKFIHWRGGSDTIRQNVLFKDFFSLAESKSKKRKYLYVLGTKYPLHFLKGARALKSVCSRNVKLWNCLQATHYETVQEYYLANQNSVEIEDVSQWVPELDAIAHTSAD